MSRNLTIGALGIVGGLGCAIIPNQATRAVELRSYTQRYVLQDVCAANTVFAKILGEYNRCEPSVRSLWDSYLNHVVTGNVGIGVRGTLTVTLSQSPWEKGSFVVEGIGDYLAYGDVSQVRPDSIKSSASCLNPGSAISVPPTGTAANPTSLALTESAPTIVASANLRVVAHQPSTFSGLRSHLVASEEVGLDGETGIVTYLDVILEQYVIREFQPQVPRYLATSFLAARIWLRRIKDGVYTVSTSEHELGLASRSENGVYRVFPIGCIRFDDAGDRRKLLDVSALGSGLGKRLLVDDYPTLATASGANGPDMTRVSAQILWSVEPPFCSLKSSMYRMRLDQLQRVATDVIGSVKECAPDPPPSGSALVSPLPVLPGQPSHPQLGSSRDSASRKQLPPSKETKQ